MSLKTWAATITAIVLFCGSALGRERKPIVYIQGHGNIDIDSDSIGAVALSGNGDAGASSATTAVNRHDQTMEMTQDFMRYCPAVSLTLRSKAHADYTVTLNREGEPTIFGELGKSQIMVLNGAKQPIYVAKKGTVKNSVRWACNRIFADWVLHGRISSNVGPGSAPEPRGVAVVFRTTKHAEARCKPQTVQNVQRGVVSYLSNHKVKLVRRSDASSVLDVTIDRPFTKWLKVTLKLRNHSGGTASWSKTVEPGGWHATTGKAVREIDNALRRSPLLVGRTITSN